MKIALIHPDLGIGGAERLVVDCAVALQNNGHEVSVFTSHHDRSHCFEETRDGTLKVITMGNTIVPRNIRNKLSIVCAILRQFHLTYTLSRTGLDFDVIIVDQLSASVPFLRLAFPNARILFYCHHPDLLLASHESLSKRLYRLPFDLLEKYSTFCSDEIVVNSKYTGKVFKQTFGDKITPGVLYPAVNPDYKAPRDFASETQLKRFPVPYFLSINRFERKKNIELAIEAYATLLHAHKDAHESMLIVAGGYDERVAENVEYLVELRALCKKYRLGNSICLPDMRLNYDKSVRVLFMPSASDSRKQLLIQNARMLLYTPENEHFGIVPLEAMSERVPVLATSTGGPLETIVDGVTGYLRSPTDYLAWYNVLGHTLLEATPEELRKMGEAGRKRVQDEFSLKKLGTDLEALLAKLGKVQRNPSAEKALAVQVKLACGGVALVGVLAVVALYYFWLFLVWFWPYFYMTINW